jgi:hypothetical protein
METQMMKRLLPMLLLAATAVMASNDDALLSPPVNGLRARLIVLPPEKPTVPFCRILIEMQNVEHGLGQKSIRFSPDKLDLHITDQSGKELPPVIGDYDGKSPNWEPTLLPMEGTIKFRISFPGLGYRPGIDKVIVDMGLSKTWIVPQDGSSYWLSGKFIVPKQEGDHQHMDWNGTLELPKVQIPKSR